MCYARTEHETLQLLPDMQATPDQQFDQWLEFLKPETACMDLFPDLPLFADEYTMYQPQEQTVSPLALTETYPSAPTPVSMDSPPVQLPVRRTRKVNKRKQDDVPPELMLKRQRNNEAARKSRERRLQKIDDLTIEVAQLQQQNQQLLTKLKVFEGERQVMQDRETQLLKRVVELEAQLSKSP
ncbi:hypothetical protein EDD86DRAFT_199937 [Gorgonomyces haynaldii]|nr:hypothetical protein EDD86DRAFT_199937 [Gorgonomyces haynaldii]